VLGEYLGSPRARQRLKTLLHFSIFQGHERQDHNPAAAFHQIRRGREQLIQLPCSSFTAMRNAWNVCVAGLFCSSGHAASIARDSRCVEWIGRARTIALLILATPFLAEPINQVGEFLSDVKFTISSAVSSWLRFCRMSKDVGHQRKPALGRGQLIAADSQIRD